MLDEMNLRYVAILVLAILTWAMVPLGNLAFISAIGVSTILWMLVAMSCVFENIERSNREHALVYRERDIL